MRVGYEGFYLHLATAAKAGSGALLRRRTSDLLKRPAAIHLLGAGRRLFEEMGLSCSLKEVFSFKYKAVVGGGLQEHELDHVQLEFANLTI